jgi:hypothetical protein
MSFEGVHIENLQIRYEGPGYLRHRRNRLDAAVRSGASDFAANLEHCGLFGDEVVCVDTIEMTETLRWGASDQSLSKHFARAVGNAVRAALALGGPGVVRYRSRRHALTDLVRRAATADTSRAWAFEAMGWWPTSVSGSAATPGACAELAIRALASEPPAIVPLLSELATSGEFESLLRYVPPMGWFELARLALRANGARYELDELRRTEEQGAPLPRASLRAALASSRILLALTGWISNDTLPQLRSALVTLAVLEAEPTICRLSTTARVALGIAEELLLAAPGSRPAKSAQPATGMDPESSESANAASVSSEPANPASSNRTAPGTASPPGAPGVGEFAPSEPGAPQLSPEVPHEGTTQAGGVLFLTHLLRDGGLYDRIAADSRLTRRTRRAVLYALARLIADLPDRDPGALAFAGLSPGSPPPETALGRWSEQEVLALRNWQLTCVEALETRLSADDRRGLDLLRWLVTRKARIVADPGWLEVHYALDSVQTEVRAAGLDLHPNWLPELGVVMRFCYV